MSYEISLCYSREILTTHKTGALKLDMAHEIFKGHC